MCLLALCISSFAICLNIRIIRKTTNIRKCHVVEEYQYKKMFTIHSKVIKVQTIEHFYSIVFLLKNINIRRCKD